MLQQESLIHQLQDQHYVQYMQQCYNQQLLQQQLAQQPTAELTADQQSQSPSHTERPQQPSLSSMASHGNGSSSVQPEMNTVESQRQKSLPNGLQKSDTADAATTSDLADEDADPSQYLVVLLYCQLVLGRF